MAKLSFVGFCASQPWCEGMGLIVESACYADLCHVNKLVHHATAVLVYGDQQHYIASGILSVLIEVSSVSTRPVKNSILGHASLSCLV